ncbi:MAG: OmpA family protein, partial [Saprospiraceae bacterium]
DAVLTAATGNIEGPVKTIKELIAKYPTWTLPRQKLSRIYYNAGRKGDALSMLESVIHLDTTSQIQQLYSLARLYEETGEMNHALICYSAVVSKSADQSGLKEKAKANRTALESKRNLWQTNTQIKFIPLPDDVNTPNHESLGRWTLDGQQIILTRLVNDQEDLFLAKFDSLKNLQVEDLPFNTNENEGATAISPDGKYIIFTSCDRKDGFGSCDLYLSIRKNGSWTTPFNMGPNFNTPSWESQPCFGQDGMTLYFSSSRPGGFGGRDIWLAHQLSNGKWGKPVNAGPEINTGNNEASPFIHFDGRTMYFMRDGKEGLGGYDLYISRNGIDGKWKTPENMRAPINSGADEGALSLHPDGRTALITRMTDHQLNDLFEFQLPEEFVSAPVQALQVNVFDEDTKNPLRARLEIFEVSGLDTIRDSQWADEAGDIAVSIERNKTYGLISSADGYLMHSVSLRPDTSSVRKLDIGMTPLASSVDKTVALENVFFTTGSSVILPASRPELNKLFLTLNANPGMKIEIRGHTDDVGTDEDNIGLSESRAKSVYQYLLDRGIEAARISYKGFGESRPVVSNETEEGRRQNRRTEFMITAN